MRRGLINRLKGVPVAIALLTILSCEAHHPTVYTYPRERTKSYDQVERDKADCREWAKSQGAGSRGEGVKGAGLGAGLGGLAGWLIFRDASAAALGATLGGGTGGVVGSQMSQEDFNRAYRACMEEKGYNVR